MNINNNINANNNNNNQVNLNVGNNNNVVTNLNQNVGNNFNLMFPPGRRRRDLRTWQRMEWMGPRADRRPQCYLQEFHAVIRMLE